MNTRVATRPGAILRSSPSLRPVTPSSFTPNPSHRTSSHIPLATSFIPLPLRRLSRGIKPAVSSNEPSTENEAPVIAGQTTFGEDSASFDLNKQTVRDWSAFFAVLTVVMIGLYGVWIAPGFGVGGNFVGSIDSLFDSSEATMLAILLVFAIHQERWVVCMS